MAKSITEKVLLESEKNLEKLRGILTEYNFEVESVVKQFPEAVNEVATLIRVYPDALSPNPEIRRNFVKIVHNYDIIPLHLAVRSRLPVKNNWVQIVMPDLDRQLTLVDFVRTLEPMGFNFTDLEYYKLDFLTPNRYTLRCMDRNPRFSGGVQFHTVAAIEPEAAPDVSMYQDLDFRHSDNDFLMRHWNFMTYGFCFTKENSLIIKCITDPDDPNIAKAVIQIDRHAHFTDGIGLVKPAIRFHLTTQNVLRKLPEEVYKELGVESSIPLGMTGTYLSSWELIDRINELYDLGITKLDVIDLRIHDNMHAFRFKSSCLGYVGELLIDINGRVGKTK